jgi:hypothetical protein
LSIAQLQIGIKGGYDYFLFIQSEESHFNTHYHYQNNGYLIGFTLKQVSSHKFNLGTEVNYTNRSFSVKSNSGGLGGYQSMNFNYTIGNMTIQFQPQFSFGTKVKFFFYPGIYFGALIHSSLKGTLYTYQMGYPVISKTDTINDNAKGYYPDFSFGILLGFGVEVPIKNNFRIIYENNITMNLVPVASGWDSDKDKMLNVNFEVGLAYTLGKNHSISSDN